MSYGNATPAPCDCITPSEKGVVTGPRKIGEISQVPYEGKDASGYNSGGNPLSSK